MQPSQGRRQPFIVAGQAPEAGGRRLHRTINANAYLSPRISGATSLHILLTVVIGLRYREPV
jgi:hypothetical protein